MDLRTKKALTGFKETKKKKLKGPKWYFDSQDVPLLSDDFEGKKFHPMPFDLTKITNREVGRLHSLRCAWLNYINQLVSIAKIAQAKDKHNYNFKRAQKLFVAKGQFKAKQFAKVRVDPEIADMRSSLVEQEAKITALNSFVWAIRQDIEALKFEMSRRRYEKDQEEG